MISLAYIREWRQNAPWLRSDQVEQEGHRVSRAEFERNFLAKLDDPRFIADIAPLAVTPSGFDMPRATELVFNRLAPLIPGDP